MAQRGTAKVVPFERRPDVVEATQPQPIALAPLELPPTRRPGWPTLAALAIASGLAAIGLGAWAVVDQARQAPSASTESDREASLAVLADAGAERYPLRGAVGRIALVVTGGGDAVLTLDGLGRAPSGMTYRAWMVPPGSVTPIGDATFDASSRVVLLERVVPPGARVGVTLERSGGADRPTRPLRLFATRP